jgi:hypothetical protein
MAALVTLLHSAEGILSKRITLGEDGKPLADGSACKMARGDAVTVAAPDAASLAALIDPMPSDQVLVLAPIKDVAPGTRVEVITANALRQRPADQRQGVISRTRDYFQFPAGGPGWMLVDTDLKGAPESVRSMLAVAGGVLAALFMVAPGLVKATRVTRLSTSTGLSDSQTGEQFPGSGGEHSYFQVKDAADIPRALEALFWRCWLHGFAWAWPGSIGQILDRAIVDRAVKTPEHLCFEGAPDVATPLVQDHGVRACRIFEGEAIDTKVIIPNLTVLECEQVKRAVAGEHQRVEPAALELRLEANTRLAETIVQREGVPIVIAARLVRSWRNGVLNPSIELVTDHEGSVLVRDILHEPERWIGVTMPDPFEGPDYGWGKAMILPSHSIPGGLYINSFAHGGFTYDLRHDVHSAREAIARAPEAGIADRLCEIIAVSDVDPVEERELLEAAVARGGIKMRELQHKLKDDKALRDKQQKQEARAARQAALTTDERPQRDLPAPDAEFGPVIEDLDTIMGDDTSKKPPMRRPDGTLTEIRTETPMDLHQLASSGSNAADGKTSVQMPAPPQPLLAPVKLITAQRMVEKHVRYRKYDKDGSFLDFARLYTSFIQAFLAIPAEESALPLVKAVCTLPMVLENGAVMSGVGLDRDTGIFYDIELSLLNCLPVGEITADDVREADAWLRDEWLCDVLTDRAGKRIAISAALSMIQRLLLDKRPAYLVTAGLRGGGKTTACHMLMMAVYGIMASAASWSTNQEERRKALFSHFRQGVACLVWDNIANGAHLSCTEVEKALTSPSVQDRILGVSEGARVPTHVVQIFVGNNIRFAGDLASRGLEIRIVTTDPNPEDRVVRHAGPVTWTRDHRAEILRRLYTILIYGCRNRPDDQIRKTRFDDWWSLVGWPVELAASVSGDELDFPSLFKLTEAEDPKRAATLNAVTELRTEFGDNEVGAASKDLRWFRAADIRTIFEQGEQARERSYTLASRLAGIDPAIPEGTHLLRDAGGYSRQGSAREEPHGSRHRYTAEPDQRAPGSPG